MNKIIISTTLVFVAFMAVALVGASDWGSDNLPYEAHLFFWHIVAMR